MPTSSYLSLFAFLRGRFALAGLLVLLCITIASSAQSVGNSGSVSGTVSDPTGAVVPNAKVEIRNPVSGFDRTTVTDSAGKFEFTNLPFNPYHLTVTADGFNSLAQDVEPRSAVPVSVAIKLQVASSNTSVTVEAEGGDLVENDPTFHTDVDKNLFDKLPLESASSSVSSLVTLVHARHRSRFQRPVPRTGRPRGELVRRSTASRSPTSKAKSSRTRFRWNRSSRWK